MATMAMSHCDGCKEGIEHSGDSHFLSQKLRCILAQKLGARWEHLGIHLGIPKWKLDEIGGEVVSVVDMACTMLNTWWRSSEEKSNMKAELLNVFSEMHRQDLIEFTNQYFQFTEFGQNIGELNKYFLEIAAKIPREWKQLGLHLYVPMSKLDIISQPTNSVAPTEKALTVLNTWFNREKNLEMVVTTLNNALIQIGRNDVASFVKSEIEKHKSICSRLPEAEDQMMVQETSDGRGPERFLDSVQNGSLDGQFVAQTPDMDFTDRGCPVGDSGIGPSMNLCSADGESFHPRSSIDRPHGPAQVTQVFGKLSIGANTMSTDQMLSDENPESLALE